MELRDYLQIIRKHIWELIVCIVLVTAGSYFFTITKPITYDANSTINILIKSAEQAPSYYEYDNFYSLQAGSLFADRVLIWFQDPAIVQDIYKKAQLGLPDVDMKQMGKLINARKKNPASVIVSMNQQDKDTVKKLVDASAQVIANKTQDLTRNESIKNIVLDISPTVVSEKKTDTLINTLVGFVAGLILGLAFVFLTEYFRPSKK